MAALVTTKNGFDVGTFLGKGAFSALSSAGYVSMYVPCGGDGGLGSGYKAATIDYYVCEIQ
ncbi:hypothetical protein Ptr902_05887 [Pyrenophora tritici-repentis]|nr:hypothetical protein Ptr902_05887 [Pyrenophora tritici-repentis]